MYDIECILLSGGADSFVPQDFRILIYIGGVRLWWKIWVFVRLLDCWIVGLQSLAPRLPFCERGKATLNNNKIQRQTTDDRQKRNKGHRNSLCKSHKTFKVNTPNLQRFLGLHLVAEVCLLGGMYVFLAKEKKNAAKFAIKR